MNDLFPSTINKSKQLLVWCQQRRIFSKADLMRYGLDNFYLRADRSIRDFVRQGLVRRLNDRDKELRKLTGNMAFYEFIN